MKSYRFKAPIYNGVELENTELSGAIPQISSENDKNFWLFQKFYKFWEKFIQLVLKRFKNYYQKNKILRNPEILAIVFFIVATIVSTTYGYSIRFYIFTDLIKHYLMLFPIFLVFLFYSKINNNYLRFGWTILALGPATSLILILANIDIHVVHKIIYWRWIISIAVSLWACSLIVYLLKRTEKMNPLFSIRKLETLSLNIIRFIRDWIPLFIVLFSYCTLKAIIPVINPKLFDEQLNIMDYYLFFKHSPTELLVKWIPVCFTGYLSFGYKFYFLIKMFAFSSIYCVVSNKEVFHRMVLAFSTTYILGLILYFLFPAQGPYFCYPEKFEMIQPHIEKTSNYQLQKMLWTVYEQVKQYPPQKFCELTKMSGVRNGIAAFPSLHIAISCVLLFFLFRYVRLVFWLCFFPFLIMVIATIYFGWHYVVDDIAGLILACFVLFIMDRLADDNNS